MKKLLKLMAKTKKFGSNTKLRMTSIGNRNIKSTFCNGSIEWEMLKSDKNKDKRENCRLCKNKKNEINNNSYKNILKKSSSAIF